MKHSQIVFSQFFIARGDTPILLQTINQPFNAVPHLVGGFVKRAAALLIGTPWNRVADPPTAQIGAVIVRTIALVAHYPVWTQLGRPGPGRLIAPTSINGSKNTVSCR